MVHAVLNMKYKFSAIQYVLFVLYSIYQVYLLQYGFISTEEQQLAVVASSNYIDIISVLARFCILLFFGYSLYTNYRDVSWIRPFVMLLMVFNMSFIMLSLGTKEPPVFSSLIVLVCITPVVCMCTRKLLHYVLARLYTGDEERLLVAYVPYISCTANMGYFGLPLVFVLATQYPVMPFYMCLALLIQLQFFIQIYPKLNGSSDKELLLTKAPFIQHAYMPLLCYIVGIFIRFFFPEIESSYFGVFLEDFVKLLKATHSVVGIVLMGSCLGYAVDKFKEYIHLTTNIGMIVFCVFFRYGLLMFCLGLVYYICVFIELDISKGIWYCLLLAVCLPPALNSLLVLVARDSVLANKAFLADITIYFCLSTFVGIFLSFGILFVALYT